MPGLLYFPGRERHEFRLQSQARALDKVQSELVENLYEMGALSHSAYAAYSKYAAEYIGHVSETKDRYAWIKRTLHPTDLKIHDCKNCDIPGNIHRKSYIEVTTRGNLAANLPPLTRANRELFEETMALYFGRHAKFRVTVSHFNFRPLFRLCRLFRGIYFENEKRFIMSTSSIDINIQFIESPARASDIDNLRWLFEKHWFEGFPLWSPTHRDQGKDQSDDTWIKDETKGVSNLNRGSMQARREGKKKVRVSAKDTVNDDDAEAQDVPCSEQPQGLFQNWMYLVRQAAALWRIAPKEWWGVTMRLVMSYKAVQKLERPSVLEARPDHAVFDLPESHVPLAEEALRVLAHATYLCLCHHAKPKALWGDKEYKRKWNGAHFYDQGWYDDPRIDFAREHEQKVADAAITYGAQVNKELRKRLGPCYAE